MIILDDIEFNLETLSDEDLLTASNQLDDFFLYLFFEVGDTHFNRSGLRNATDKLVDYLSKRGYYPVADTAHEHKEVAYAS